MRVRKVLLEVRVDVADFGYPPHGLGKRAEGLLEQAVISGIVGSSLTGFVELKVLSDELVFEDRDQPRGDLRCLHV
jgi:hypothetical protein